MAMAMAMTMMLAMMRMMMMARMMVMMMAIAMAMMTISHLRSLRKSFQLPPFPHLALTTYLLHLLATIQHRAYTYIWLQHMSSAVAFISYGVAYVVGGPKYIIWLSISKC